MELSTVTLSQNEGPSKLIAFPFGDSLINHQLRLGSPRKWHNRVINVIEAIRKQKLLLSRKE